jgi:GAF domain-containing protein
MRVEERNGASLLENQPDQIARRAVQQAIQMLENGEPQPRILACLVEAAETIAGGGSVSSILVLDKEGLLRNSFSPNLPPDYLTAIDGLKPDPFVGTCASAAATGSVVITPDFKSDDKWGELRHLPLSLGFVGAWSMPIKNTEGKVIGTFGTYYREQRTPTRQEIQSIRQLADAAAKTLA